MAQCNMPEPQKVKEGLAMGQQVCRRENEQVGRHENDICTEKKKAE